MTAETASKISCGIAGWSYADWQGFVYPPGTKDQLCYVAPYVDMIEINSSFYRPPTARTVQSWIRRTRDLPDFFFTAKLHQDITHKGRLEPAMVAAIHDGFEPMVDAGRLRHLLAQFRYDFVDTPETRRHLNAIKDTFGDLANITFELRHKSWEAPDALEALGALDVTVANLDYPLARDSFDLRTCRVGQHAYLRLHGRNAKAWFDRNAGRDETYNYAYSDSELDDIVERAIDIAAHSQTLTLVANNHYQGKEAAAALELKARIAGVPVPVPPILAERYPSLERIRDRKGPPTPPTELTLPF